MTDSNQAIPSTNQPLVKILDGTVTYPWYRLFLTLWNRTGGASGETSNLPTQVTTPIGTLLTAATLNSSTILRSGPPADFVDNVDSAKSYVSAHNFPTAPSTNFVLFINLTAFNWTITPVNTVSFLGNLSAGNYIIPAHSQRTFTIEIDSVERPAIKFFG